MLKIMALTLFIALMTGGEQILGRMQGHSLQLALVSAFIFGILCSYRPHRH